MEIDRFEKLDRLNESITELQKISDAVERDHRHRAQIMKAIFAAMPDSVVYIDGNYKVIWANVAAARLISSTPEGIEGQKCYDLKGWDHLCEDCPAKRAMETGIPQQTELVQGECVYAVSTAPVDVNGYHGAICVSRDITHRERNAELVRREYLRAEAFCRIGTEGIVIHRGGEVVAVNQKFVDLIGYNEEDFRADPELGWKVIAPEFRDKVKKMIKDDIFEPYMVEYVTKHHGRVPMFVKPDTLDYGNGIGLCRVAIITPWEGDNGR